MPDRRGRPRAAARPAAVGLSLLLAGAWPAFAPSAVLAADPEPRPEAEVVLLVPGDQGPQEPTTRDPDTGLIITIGAGVAVAVAVLGGGFLLLRRRDRFGLQPPPGPAEGGDWWTCPKCGRNNMVGSPRCYSCGAWQR